MPARDALAKQIQRFLDHLTIERGLSVHTVAAYHRDLERYATFLRARGITAPRRVDERAVTAHVAAVSASTYGDGRSYRASSVVRALSSVRAFHRFLLKDGKISSDPTSAVIRPKLPRSLPKPLSVDDVARVLAHPDRSAKGLRDRPGPETLYGAHAPRPARSRPPVAPPRASGTGPSSRRSTAPVSGSPSSSGSTWTTSTSRRGASGGAGRAASTATWR